MFDLRSCRSMPSLRLGSCSCLEIQRVTIQTSGDLAEDSDSSISQVITVQIMEGRIYIWHVENLENMTQKFAGLIKSLLKARFVWFEIVCCCIPEVWWLFSEESFEARYPGLGAGQLAEAVVCPFLVFHQVNPSRKFCI